MLTERSARIALGAPAAAPVPADRGRRVPGRGRPGGDRGDRLRQGQPGAVLELYVTEAAAAKHVESSGPRTPPVSRSPRSPNRAAAALSDAVTPQGIVARCAIPTTDLGDVLAGSPKLVAVLVRTNDPGNAGTVIRLADAAGADGVIVAGDAVDPFNPKAVRASAGSLFHLPVVPGRRPGRRWSASSSAAGLSVLATTGPPTSTWTPPAADGILDLPTAWLFGSEAHGLPRGRGRPAPMRPCGCRSTAGPSRSTWPRPRRSACTPALVRTGGRPSRPPRARSARPDRTPGPAFGDQHMSRPSGWMVRGNGTRQIRTRRRSAAG